VIPFPGRSFQARLLGLMVVILFLLQAATLTAVHLAGLRNLRNTLAEELDVGSRVLDRILGARGRQLSDTVRVLAADFAFREAVASGDHPTLISVLANHGSRIGADAVFLLSLEGAVVADTLGGRFADRPFPLSTLVERSRSEGEASAIASIDGRPFQLVVVPVLAPQPIAFVCIGFTIGSGVLEDVRRLTALDVSLWSAADGAEPLLVSTLPPREQAELAEWIRGRSATGRTSREAIRLGADAYESLLRPLETADGSGVNTLLQRSVEDAGRPQRRLELQIFGLSAATLVLALLGALFFARGVSRPLVQLADAARRMEHGDYETPIALELQDETGQLAAALDKMRSGIRDREEQIRHQATHDALTGLPNRVLLLDRIEHAIVSARRRGGLVGMAMMDLDRFKEINDTLGHSLGDELLTEIGRRLRLTLRESDTVARLGGDEFAVMFETAGEAGAVDVAQRIGRALETPFALGQVTVEVKASMGIALYPTHADDAGTLMKRADVAMYEAKRGQTAFALYEPGRDAHSLRRLAILSELRQAVESGQLEVHYQPKVDLRTERVVHAEALVRWRHPVHGMVRPDEFIPLAEQSGNIGMITKWVLREAIAACAAWGRAGHELTVAVNLSVLDLYQAELPTYVSGLLHDSGLPPSRLVLEITESGVMKDPAYAQRILRDLKARGVAIAIDDYGTGYSSLAHLKRLPVDELKIDKSFVSSLSASAAEDAVIVRSTIELGHNMGLRVIAEGVEDAEAWRMLRDFGCDMAQGFYVSRPLPAADFLSWMSDSPWVSRGASGGPGA